jgi:hypothetical protein
VNVQLQVSPPSTAVIVPPVRWSFTVTSDASFGPVLETDTP